MEKQGEQQAQSRYNDSAADTVAALALLTIAVAVAVFWVAGQ